MTFLMIYFRYVLIIFMLSSSLEIAKFKCSLKILLPNYQLLPR
jgi:hypothetical protein